MGGCFTIVGNIGGAQYVRENGFGAQRGGPDVCSAGSCTGPGPRRPRGGALMLLMPSYRTLFTRPLQLAPDDRARLVIVNQALAWLTSLLFIMLQTN